MDGVDRVCESCSGATSSVHKRAALSGATHKEAGNKTENTLDLESKTWFIFIQAFCLFRTARGNEFGSNSISEHSIKTQNNCLEVKECDDKMVFSYRLICVCCIGSTSPFLKLENDLLMQLFFQHKLIKRRNKSPNNKVKQKQLNRWGMLEI